MSSAMLWLYIKDFYPNANLEYICHEHKQHGLEDIIDDDLYEQEQRVKETLDGSKRE